MPTSRSLAAHSIDRAQAVVVARLPLFYRDGGDAKLARPPHVRAGSSLAARARRGPDGAVESGLWLVQDDAHFLARVVADADPSRRLAAPLAEAWPLPAGADGQHVFAEATGNKRFKFDLEALCSLPEGLPFDLLAFGSGSAKHRTHVVPFHDPPQTTDEAVGVVQAAALYRVWADEVAFSGADMNIEGAAATRSELVLLNRGNGAATATVPVRNTLGQMSLQGAIDWLMQPERQPPGLDDILELALGRLQGATLSWTDLVIDDHGTWFSATAEDSPNARDDGEITGSVVGFVESQRAWWMPIRDASGRLLKVKVEGLAWAARDHLWLLVDNDDPNLPSELLLAQLVGL
jgi:hypothetical protein